MLQTYMTTLSPDRQTIAVIRGAAPDACARLRRVQAGCWRRRQDAVVGARRRRRLPLEAAGVGVGLSETAAVGGSWTRSRMLQRLLAACFSLEALRLEFSGRSPPPEGLVSEFPMRELRFNGQPTASETTWLRSMHGERERESQRARERYMAAHSLGVHRIAQLSSRQAGREAGWPQIQGFRLFESTANSQIAIHFRRI